MEEIGTLANECIIDINAVKVSNSISHDIGCMQCVMLDLIFLPYL